jgi:ribosomal protein S6--L-glutamate ligase
MPFGSPRVAILLRSEPGGGPRVSGVIDEVIARLRGRGACVDLIVPEDGALDIAEIRPAHDLYVLKEKTPLNLSVAGALTIAGAAVVNTVRSCTNTRDKIVATALLAAAGVPVPPSWTTASAPGLRALVDDGPIWLKSPRGSRGAGVSRVTESTAPEIREAPKDAHGLPLPLFAQREVPSAGRDLKVFVVGDAAWAIARPFPARTLEEKLGAPVALRPEVHDAALRCGRALGLELYGVDFLEDGDEFFVVDVNAFPGYKGAREAPAAIAEHLYRRARRQDAALSDLRGGPRRESTRKFVS